MNSDVSAIAKFSDFKDLLIEAKTIKTTEKGMKSITLFQNLAIFRKISFFILLLLAFFERPLWCTVDYSENCRLSPDKSTQIPTSNIPYLKNVIYYPIESVVISFLTYNRYLKQTFLKSVKSRYWFYTLVAITIIIVIEGVIKASVEDYHVNISLFLRPLYFISFNRVLRKTLIIYIKIIEKVVPIFIIIAFNIIFFSVLGRIIFYNQQNDDYFNSFFDTCFNFIVLQTTSNFPDVMMSYYNEHRWAPLFFICFLLINLILLLNTVLAVFYSNYKKEMEIDTKKFFFKNREKMNEYLHSYIVANNNRQLSKENGQVLQSLMRVNTKAQKQMMEQFKFSRELDQLADQPIKALFIRIFQSTQWNIFMGCLSLFNFSILYVMAPSMASKTDLSLWAAINLSINIIFFLEQLAQVIIFKRKYFRVKKYYIFDFIVSILIISLILIYFITLETEILHYCMYIICTRITRFIFILFKFQSFKMIFRTVYNFIPLFVNLFGVLFLMFFIFSALGQHIFGGKMTYAYEEEINNQTGTKFYVLNNFNDTATSLVLLFELLIVNNWMVNVQVHQIIMNTKNVRFFFIIWYIVAVLICMNIMVAFIIDHLVNKLNDQDKVEEEEHIQSQLFMENNNPLRNQRLDSKSGHQLRFSIFSSQTDDNLQKFQSAIKQNHEFNHQLENIQDEQQ